MGLDSGCPHGLVERLSRCHENPRRERSLECRFEDDRQTVGFTDGTLIPKWTMVLSADGDERLDERLGARPVARRPSAVTDGAYCHGSELHPARRSASGDFRAPARERDGCSTPGRAGVSSLPVGLKAGGFQRDVPRAEQSRDSVPSGSCVRGDCPVGASWRPPAHVSVAAGKVEDLGFRPGAGGSALSAPPRRARLPSCRSRGAA